MNVSLTVASPDLKRTRLHTNDGREDHLADFPTVELGAERFAQLVAQLLAEACKDLTTGRAVGVELHLITEPDLVELAQQLIV